MAHKVLVAKPRQFRRHLYSPLNTTLFLSLSIKHDITQTMATKGANIVLGGRDLYFYPRPSRTYIVCWIKNKGAIMANNKGTLLSSDGFAMGSPFQSPGPFWLQRPRTEISHPWVSPCPCGYVLLSEQSWTSNSCKRQSGGKPNMPNRYNYEHDLKIRSIILVFSGPTSCGVESG